MPINRFYTTTITVKRLEWSGDSSAFTASTTFSGHIQQDKTDLAQQLGFRFGELYNIWCPLSTDVKRNDRLEEGSNTYDVQDVFEFATGNETHLQIIATRHNIE